MAAPDPNKARDVLPRRGNGGQARFVLFNNIFFLVQLIVQRPGLGQPRFRTDTSPFSLQHMPWNSLLWRWPVREAGHLPGRFTERLRLVTATIQLPHRARSLPLSLSSLVLSRGGAGARDRPSPY